MANETTSNLKKKKKDTQNYMTYGVFKLDKQKAFNYHIR